MGGGGDQACYVNLVIAPSPPPLTFWRYLVGGRVGRNMLQGNKVQLWCTICVYFCYRMMYVFVMNVPKTSVYVVFVYSWVNYTTCCKLLLAPVHSAPNRQPQLTLNCSSSVPSPWLASILMLFSSSSVRRTLSQVFKTLAGRKILFLHSTCRWTWLPPCEHKASEVSALNLGLGSWAFRCSSQSSLQVIAMLVESSWNVIAHGDHGRGSEGESGEWSG